MKILSGEMYKDCSTHDFNHYFSNTAMVYSLKGSNKKRVFLVTGYENDKIYGQYLTREKLWKAISFSWGAWWEKLSTIPPFPIFFNTGAAAASLIPNLHKNLKKSIPYHNSLFSVYGKANPEDISAQSLVYQAFKELYEYQEPLGTLDQAIKDEIRTATACRGGFILDKFNKDLIFKGGKIGKFTVEGEIELPYKFRMLEKWVSSQSSIPIKVLAPEPVKEKQPSSKTPTQISWEAYAKKMNIPTDISIAYAKGFVSQSVFTQHLHELAQTLKPKVINPLFNSSQIGINTQTVWYDDINPAIQGH